MALKVAALAFLSLAVPAASEKAASAETNLLGAQISISVSPNPSAFGAPVTLTATVTPSAATGKVTFYDGVMVLGTAQLSAGSSSLSTVMLAAGTRKLKAYYAGDGAHAPAVSTVLPHTVQATASNIFGTTYIPDSGPASAVAVGDFNGDGKADIAAAGPNGIQVWLGAGNGSFANPIAAATLSAGAIAVGDFNGDGKADMAVATTGVTILLGNGDGTFQTGGAYTGSFDSPRAIVAGDFNGDGIIDLAAASFYSSNVSVWLGKGDGSFLPAVNYPSSGGGLTALTADDFNGDGLTDLAVVTLVTQ